MAHWLVSTLGTRTAEGFSFALLKHWVNYYLDLGFAPEHWRLTLFSSSLSDNMGAVADWLETKGIKPVACIPNNPQFNVFESDDERHRLRAELPSEDWVSSPDPDEFYGFTRRVPELSTVAEANNYNVIAGEFCDRLAADLTLPEVTDAPLFEQFPLETSLTAKMVYGVCTKVCAYKNYFAVGTGHHCTWSHKNRIDPHWVKVHHFKWTKGLRQRVLRHLTLQDPRYNWQVEGHRVLEHLTEDDRLIVNPEEVAFEWKSGTP